MADFLFKKFIKDCDNINDPKVREKYGYLSGGAGICCNLLLTAAKFTVGTVTNSISIVADAANNLSDASSSVVTLVGSKISNKPADKEHPFGHGRFEYISALIVAFLILLMGVELLKSSVTKIFNPSPITFNLAAFIVLLLTIPVKLWMAYFNKKIYKKTSILSMKAVSQDSINDCFATGATIISLLVSSLTKVNIDGYIGIVVAVLILIAGIKMIKDIVAPLLGQAPDEKTVRQIEEIILSHKIVIGVHDLIIHSYGPSKTIASAHAEVPSNVNILEIHDEIDNIEKQILEEMNITTVIHMDPLVVNDEKINELKYEAEIIIKSINERFQFHDFRVVEGPTHTNIIFDLIIPHDYKTKPEDLNVLLEQKFKELNSNYNLVVTIEHGYL